jgi:hypothetical protein
MLDPGKEAGQNEFEGDEEACEEGDQGPDEGHEGEGADDLVVVGELLEGWGAQGDVEGMGMGWNEGRDHGHLESPDGTPPANRQVDLLIYI